MACCPQTRRWRTGRIRLPCPITACTAPSRPRRKSCCRRYSGAYRQAVPGKKPTHTGRDATKEATGIKHEISIHAPHTGRDACFCRLPSPLEYFNPRAPYGARLKYRLVSEVQAQFQSTRPIRGATRGNRGLGDMLEISIHAPHTGRDPPPALCRSGLASFQSTRPIRGATSNGEH